MPPFFGAGESGSKSPNAGNINLTMNHSYRSRTSTIQNPSQVSVIQSQASCTVDEDGVSQGSFSNRNRSFKGNRFSNLDAFKSVNHEKKRDDNDEDGTPMSPGLNRRTLRRQKSITNAATELQIGALRSSDKKSDTD